MFFAFFLELFSSSSYNKGSGVFAILQYRIDAYKAPLLIKPPVQQNLNKPPLFWTKSPLFEAF